MPRPYPAEFRARAIALVRAGKPSKQTAVELGSHPVTLSKWLRQDEIDHGLRPGKSSAESTELRAARRRIRDLESEVRSSGRLRSSSVRTSLAQKALPGDRPSRRRRGTGGQMLPDPRGRPAELLQAQTNSGHAQMVDSPL